MVDRDIRALVSEPKQMMGHEKKYTGTLTFYEDEDTTLELYNYPSNFHSKHYVQNDVIWGQDANGHIFTLFNALITQKKGIDFSTTKFVVGLVLIGEHILSGDDAHFNKCVVQFPYLRNWAFQNKIKGPDINLSALHTPSILLEAQCEEGVCWRLRQYQPVERTIHDLTITQTTEFEIETTKPQSIKSFLTQIEAFSQFLSIALLCDQNCTSIKFVDGNPWNDKVLLYKKEASVKPGLFSLIKFDLLKDKLPSMLREWYNKFERVAPITSYLIQSLQRKNSFEVPDFLIIAQALDGYFKRFEDENYDGKKIYYKEEIELLLNNLKDIDVIKRCNINAEVLKDSRHKYSHLYPDEKKMKAVEGEDLYWLTEKCKVLLICCILKMIGMTNEEINLCCEKSPIQDIINAIPLE